MRGCSKQTCKKVQAVKLCTLSGLYSVECLYLQFTQTLCAHNCTVH